MAKTKSPLAGRFVVLRLPNDQENAQRVISLSARVKNDLGVKVDHMNVGPVLCEFVHPDQWPRTNEWFSLNTYVAHLMNDYPVIKPSISRDKAIQRVHQYFTSDRGE